MLEYLFFFCFPKKAETACFALPKAFPMMVENFNLPPWPFEWMGMSTVWEPA